MPRECVSVCARPRVPETDGVINTATSEGGPIGAKRYASDTPRMPRECVSVCARPRVPETDGAIPTGTSEGGA